MRDLPADVRGCLVAGLPRECLQVPTIANGLEEKGIMKIGLYEQCRGIHERLQYVRHLFGTHVTLEIHVIQGTHGILGINVNVLNLEAMLRYR